MARYTLNPATESALPRDPAVDGSLRRLAEEILDDAQQRVPVDTGDLRDSGFVDGGDSDYRIGFDADYAAFVEYGTGDTDPQPYLEPAALQSRGRL